MPITHVFDPVEFSIDVAFTLIAVIFCFLIYFKTRESYELTKYEGIKYFRGAFFFFGLSYLLRFFLSLVILSKIAFDFILPREMFAPFFILFLGYFSTIGIFYLIFSSIWDKFQKKQLLLWGHVIAIILSVISFLTRSHFILLALQFVFLIAAMIFSFVIEKERKKITKIRVLYFLVCILWLLNLLTIDHDRGRFFSIDVDLYSQIISLVVFIIIYYKISKWVK